MTTKTSEDPKEKDTDSGTSKAAAAVAGASASDDPTPGAKDNTQPVVTTPNEEARRRAEAGSASISGVARPSHNPDDDLALQEERRRDEENDRRLRAHMEATEKQGSVADQPTPKRNTVAYRGMLNAAITGLANTVGDATSIARRAVALADAVAAELQDEND